MAGTRGLRNGAQQDNGTAALCQTRRISDRLQAKKFMADLSPTHMQAHTVLRQLQKHLGPLFPPLPPSTPTRPALFLPPLPNFNPPERALVGAWKAYLKWEESNPLEVEEKDRATLHSRVQHVYRKAVVRMRFYGEIWYAIRLAFSRDLVGNHLPAGTWRTRGRTASARRKKRSQFSKPGSKPTLQGNIFPTPTSKHH